MVSPKSHLYLKVFLFVISLFSATASKAQCNPPDQLPTPTCDEAPTICLTDACYTTLNNPLVCCTGFCGNMTIINNPQYFAFTPTLADVEIDIHVDNCSSGSGLQSAIINACPWSGPNEVLACNGGSPPGATMVLIASGLVPGQTYWLMIDGNNGATCQYTIDFVAGVFEPQIDEDLTSIEAIPDVVCQGFNNFMLTAEPSIGNAHGYYWVLEWNNDTLTTTLPEITFDIPDDAPPGTWSICARAFSGCDTTDTEVCVNIEIVELDDEEKGPDFFCPEEFPIYWGALDINGPGTYTQEFFTPDGCPFDSVWYVDQYPDVEVGMLDTLHCEESLIYEGEFYDNAGMYQLEYPGMGMNGCDSTAELNVTLAAINAYIELNCENGEFVLNPIIEDLVPANADIDWQWYDGATPIFDNIPYVTLFDGCYTLYATIITPAGNCTFFVEQYCFVADDLRPDPPNMGFTDTLLCAQSGVFFEVIVDPFAEPYTYTWSGPANVPIIQDGSAIAEFDFTNSGPADICVYATNECGDGPATCFMVDIKPAPLAAFTSDPEICADSMMVITFTGTASVNAEIIWNFDSPTNVTGSGIGPYNVSWAVPGNKLVTLTVIEPGCDTSFVSHPVAVSNFQAPVINCSSTISSVDFDWDDVVGASGYLVSINSGPDMPTGMSNWQVTGLNPGDVVNITITCISAGPCDDIVVMSSCIAQNCPPPAIVISGQDSACLNNPAIIDLEVLVNGSQGVGAWAGPGIVDVNMGLFDPKVAAAGQHQVTFTAIVGGCPFIEPYTITVFDSITADFTIDPIICIADVATVTFTGNASGGATYDYDFTPATVVSGSGAGPYQLRWSSSGPQTVRLQVSENGCFSDIISQNTVVSATMNPPVINCAPNTSGILFTWTVDPVALSHSVNTLTAQVGVPSGNSLNFTGLNPGDIVAIEIVTLSGGPCPDRRDTLECTARACPMPIITVTPVQDVCLYPGTVPIDLEVVVTNGNGVGDWSGPGISDPVNGIFDPVVAGPGAHQITYHYLDDGCDFLNSITINVYDPPGAFISNTDLIITCASGSLFLDGSGSSGVSISYLWSTDDGVINGPKNMAIAEAIAPGLYQLLVTNSISGCVDSMAVMVSQDANIPTPKAGPDRTITCDSTQFVLGGGSTTGPDIIYIWSTTIGNIMGATNTMQVTVDAVGDYDLIVRDTVTGCQSTDRAVVGIDTAVATIQLTPGDTIDCNTTMSTVQSTLSEPFSDYDLQWMTLDGTISGSTIGQDISVTQGGTYTLTIEHNGNGCQNAESAFVAESDEIIDAVDVSLMNIVCHGDANGALTINSVDGGTPPYTYQWSGNQQGGTMLTSLGPGQYTLTISDGNGCSFTQTYAVTEPDLVTLDIGSDMTVRERDSVTLIINTNLTPDGISTIEWGGYDGLFCPGCPIFEFIATSSATISAIISDTAGCLALDSMRLTVVVPKIYFIPNVFSPNDDDINDYFFISGRFNLVNIGYLKIFDRWGNQVFENTDLTPGVKEDGWDGKFNEKHMQPGVYVYIAQLDFEDISETVKGEVTIIR
jgi:gliding motility-associated-like protein